MATFPYTMAFDWKHPDVFCGGLVSNRLLLLKGLVGHFLGNIYQIQNKCQTGFSKEHVLGSCQSTKGLNVQIYLVFNDQELVIWSLQ